MSLSQGKAMTCLDRLQMVNSLCLRATPVKFSVMSAGLTFLKGYYALLRSLYFVFGKCKKMLEHVVRSFFDEAPPFEIRNVSCVVVNSLQKVRAYKKSDVVNGQLNGD